MSIGKKPKDHLRAHGGISPLEPITAPKSDDPLRFWTNHPTENVVVDLHPLADGETESPRGYKDATWRGPYFGRAKLIAELAPAIQARLSMGSSGSARCYINALRAWWRLFDAFENTPLADGRQAPSVESVADLNALHESFSKQNRISPDNFRTFLKLANDTRAFIKLPPLLWEAPRVGTPVRNLIPDDQARELKTAIKQDWECVRKTWARNDAIRAEAVRRDAGEPPSTLGEGGEFLVRNWLHLQRVKEKTETLLPTYDQLLDGASTSVFFRRGLASKTIWAIEFPTTEEADIAYHMALMNSGWNPSTMANLNAESPFLVTNHPKDAKQLVLSADQSGEEITLQGIKPRARGKMQFCMGLAKHSASPPVIVAAYLRRTESLREILLQDYAAAQEKLLRMQNDRADGKRIEKQYNEVQRLAQGCRRVWLFVNGRGQIRWIDIYKMNRYGPKGGIATYLSLVVGRLNERRASQGSALIANVTDSDFRDIYARWVYKQSGGNILAVMLALGHSRINTTVNYVENNIFSAEHDEDLRRFMTSLFQEWGKGRIDLTILAQLVRHGPLTSDMESRLIEYRQLMKSRIGIGCTNPRHPPPSIAPNHDTSRLCGSHRCLMECPNARFLPESLNGIAMRIEELTEMSNHLPRETWLQGNFDAELDSGIFLLETLYPKDVVTAAREKWHARIVAGEHPIPGLGRIT